MIAAIGAVWRPCGISPHSITAVRMDKGVMHRFQLVISTRSNAVAVRLVEVRTESRARQIAEQVLSESPDHLGVDVWEGEAYLFTLGESHARVA
jgi:hypothetical protein